MNQSLPALVRRLLRAPPIVYRAPGSPNAVALTFDDGPSEWTAQIAAALETRGCLGTFFVRGAAAEELPDTVAALARAGHEVGNHLWTHSDPARQSPGALRAEIDRTAAMIASVTGKRPDLVRPPYCGAPRRVAWAARGGGASMIALRSVDPADWDAASADEIVESVLGEVGPGDIVCLHDGVVPETSGKTTRSATAAAVARLVPSLLDRGLRPVTVSQLLS
jgi:peptidoglycan/xylan/chitin deacetylase (PgdA/CDA1 family)